MSEHCRLDSIISVEDAQTLLLSKVALLDSEEVVLTASYGRVLAQDIVSDIDISPFDNSSMDGFALRCADLCTASSHDAADTPPGTTGTTGGTDKTGETRLTIVGFIGAGSTFSGEVAEGQCVRIMTGAPMPAGADTVVKIEDVEVFGQDADTVAGTHILVKSALELGANVRMHGEDAHAGDILLRSGAPITAAAAGLLASTGHCSVHVTRQPRVAILSTGNELVDPSVQPGPGQIRNSNSYSLSAQVFEAGGLPHICPMVADNAEALAQALKTAAADHDFVITSGGAAEGDFDYITKVVGELGTLFYNKVDMKPGKAQTFGLIEDVPFFGLPGNPVAAAVGFEILIRPALRKMQGLEHLKRPITRARLGTDINKKNESRRLYLRARLEHTGGGNYEVHPETNQSSALLSALSRSNCLLVIPEGFAPVAAGETVACLRLDIDEGVI